MVSPGLDRVWRLVSAGPFRLALMALAVLMPAAALFAVLIGWQVNTLLANNTLEALREELQTFRSELERGGMRALTGAVKARAASPGRGLYRLAVEHDGGAALAGNLKDFPAGASTTGGVFEVWDAVDQRMHAAAGLVVPVTVDSSLLVARDIEDQRLFAERLRRAAFAGVGLMTFAALTFGWVASRRINRRIADVTTTASSIMAGDFSRRIPQDRSGDEFDRLASSLNAMLSRIEDLMQALREVSDNIAHDLKTPLTRLRNHAEAALRDDTATAHRDGLERVIEEADGLIQTFNALLLIARLEAGAVDSTRIECDISNLVGDVTELYQPVADDAGLQVSFERGRAVHLAVNRQLVGQAVANMLDNAIKYSAGTPTSASGPVTVKVSLRSDGGVEIAVSDRGPGIAPADRERAIRRFVRLEQSRSRPGTGLGLSLVAAVARLHGGTVRLEDNAPGLRIVLVLGHAEQPRTAKAALPGVFERAASIASAAR